MLHVARGRLDLADALLRKGTAIQDRRRERRERFPALGLHWLKALIHLAGDDIDSALTEFDHELNLADPSRLYGREYVMYARHGRGMALLRAGRPDDALREFERALELYPEHAPTHLAVAVAHQGLGRSRSVADAALVRTDAALSVLARSRPVKAAMVRAARLAAAGQPSDASRVLLNMLKDAPPGFAGWTIPVEPLFRDLVHEPSFAVVRKVLAERAA
jgi:tetratricopeptide (TPR) repeat protein